VSEADPGNFVGVKLRTSLPMNKGEKKWVSGKCIKDSCRKEQNKNERVKLLQRKVEKTRYGKENVVQRRLPRQSRNFNTLMSHATGW
jgi:hypothetical protein